MKRKIEQIERIANGCGKRINLKNYHLYCGDYGMHKLRLCPACLKRIKLLNAENKSEKKQ